MPGLQCILIIIHIADVILEQCGRFREGPLAKRSEYRPMLPQDVLDMVGSQPDQKLDADHVGRDVLESRPGASLLAPP